VRSEIGGDPPKSPLKRGTKISIGAGSTFYFSLRRQLEVKKNSPKCHDSAYPLTCVHSLVRSEIGGDPPKSPLKRGTKIRILAPFLRGFGGFRSRNEVQPNLEYTVSLKPKIQNPKPKTYSPKPQNQS
jgi:hypothetical protein